MTTIELDPVFLKALRLLHSKAKESAEQLKQLLDDTLHQHHQYSGYGQSSDAKEPLPSLKFSVKKSPPSKHVAGDSSSSSSTSSSSSSAFASRRSPAVKDDDGNAASKTKKEAEKRTFDKLRQDLDSHALEVKRAKLDSPKTSNVLRSPSPVVTKEEQESSSDENTNATDMAVQMGLACVVCRSIDVTSGNTLVECQDCHSLYHQECHKPPITDQDVNDPRLVWYCAKCTKNMKKMASKNQKPAKPATSSTTTKESVTLTKPVKAEPPPAAPPATHIFKRAEPKTSGSSTTSAGATSSSNKPIGLAGLAASLSGKSHQPIKPSQPSGGKPPMLLAKSLPATAPASSGSKAGGGPQQGLAHKNSAFSSLLMSTKTSQGNSGDSSLGSTGAINSLYAAKSSSTSAAATSVALASKPLVSSGGSSSSTVSGSSASSSSGGGGGNGGSASAGGTQSSSSKSASSSSLMSADKRLQIMKKKAAAKMQEKRRLSAK